MYLPGRQKTNFDDVGCGGSFEAIAHRMKVWFFTWNRMGFPSLARSIIARQMALDSRSCIYALDGYPLLGCTAIEGAQVEKRNRDADLAG